MPVQEQNVTALPFFQKVLFHLSNITKVIYVFQEIELKEIVHFFLIYYNHRIKIYEMIYHQLDQ